MKSMRVLIGLAALLLVVVAIPTLAQEPGGRPQQPPTTAAPAPATAAQPRAQEPTTLTAKGELVKVDDATKLITIKADAKAEPNTPTQFTYTDATKVTGAEKAIAGLATMTGESVTVHYMKKDQANVATQIDVQAKKE
jgi:Cu/Ag efflux protein CusF